MEEERLLWEFLIYGTPPLEKGGRFRTRGQHSFGDYSGDEVMERMWGCLHENPLVKRRYHVSFKGVAQCLGGIKSVRRMQTIS